ncbi:MAG: hypothetical protein IIU54_03585, partial [Phascolarctobacterium sp.]|nr:hypothetical protein [Phascolarctobacterium sp.]
GGMYMDDQKIIKLLWQRAENAIEALAKKFGNILIPSHGNYLDNCWAALKCALWQCFAAVIVNIDLTILWMKRKRVKTSG